MFILQECGEEVRDLSSEEIVLDGDVSKRLKNFDLQQNSPTSSGCGEDGSIAAEEKKASYLSIIFLIFMVTVYPGFIAILYLYFVFYIKPRMLEACSQSNICNLTVENFGLLHISYNDDKVYHARYMVDEILPAFSEAIINEYKLAAKFFNGKKVTKICRILLEDNEDGDISNSALNKSKESDGKLIDDSTDLTRKKNMENYVQIGDFNLSDDHSHSQTYIGDLPVNDSGFMNISSSVNKMPYNYEESELTDFSSKTERYCKTLLKVDYNMLKEKPVTAKNCSKAPVECFGTSSHELSMSFVKQSNSEKTNASTSSSSISVDNDNKFSYNLTSWTRGETEKSHKESNKIQNGEDNKGDDRSHDQRNATDLQDNCFLWVSFVDDASLQGSNDENNESNYSPEKKGISHETPIVDDPNLGNVLTLTTDSSHGQHTNWSLLTDVSSVVYGDFKINADSGNANTSNEFSIELVGKCENKSNNIAEFSGQVLQNESESHDALKNTLSKQGNGSKKLAEVCVVERVDCEMKSGISCVPCCSLKMDKACSKIARNNNISALATDCRSDRDFSSEIDNSDSNHCILKGSCSVLYETCDKLKDPNLCMAIGDLSNDYGDCDITHKTSQGARSKFKKTEDTKFPQCNYNNVTGRNGISRDKSYVLITIIEKFLEGLKRKSEVQNSIFDKSKKMCDMPSIYVKKEKERHERNTVKIQGRTKLGCIYITVDGAKVHGKMLTYQR